MLTTEIQRVVNGQKRIEGQAANVTAKVTFEAGADDSLLLVIDLSKGYLPREARYFGAEMEDLTSELANVASELVHDIVRISGVKFLYGGKDVDYYLSDEQRLNPPPGERAAAAAAASVVVAAGHGVYYHYGFNDWRPQRDPSNGITEDFITPDYATELAAWMKERSVATVSFLRSTAATTHKAK